MSDKELPEPAIEDEVSEFDDEDPELDPVSSLVSDDEPLEPTSEDPSEPPALPVSPVLPVPWSLEVSPTD